MPPRKRPDPGVRALVRDLDDRIKDVDRQLAEREQLRIERRRLLQARASLLGEPKPGSSSGAPRVSQEQVADYLAQHGPAKASAIAEHFGVPLGNISTHLYRGKGTRFENTRDGWQLAQPKRRRR
jgi:hypothetical protein